MKLETVSQIVIAALLAVAGHSYISLTTSVAEIARAVHAHDVQIAAMQARERRR